MLRQFVIGICVMVSAPVWGQSKSGLDDIGERLQWQLRENSRATRRAMDDEVNAFVSRPYVESAQSRQLRARSERQQAYELEERLRRLEFEANERRYRIR